jgi:hypothetical protein
MESYEVDMTDPKQAEEVEIAYYLLYSDDLRCTELVTTPDMEDIRNADKWRVVAVKDDGQIVGVACVKNGFIYYPVMTGDYEAVLRELVLKGAEVNGGSLSARTKNELILTTATNMGIGVIRDENTLEYN